MKHFLSVSRSPSNSNSNKSTTQHKRREEAQGKRCSTPARRHRQRSIIVSGPTETHTRTQCVSVISVFSFTDGIKGNIQLIFKDGLHIKPSEKFSIVGRFIAGKKIFSTLNPIKRHLFLLPQEKLQNRRIWKYLSFHVFTF